MQSSNLTEARAMRDSYETESEREAFAAGYDHAHGIACHNVPKVAETYWTESEGRFTPADPTEARELHETLCYEAESNARCYSPWEFTAAELNSLSEVEAAVAWDAYDAGVAAAIGHDLAGYEDSDYELA